MNTSKYAMNLVAMKSAMREFGIKGCKQVRLLVSMELHRNSSIEEIAKRLRPDEPLTKTRPDTRNQLRVLEERGFVDIYDHIGRTQMWGVTEKGRRVREFIENWPSRPEVPRCEAREPEAAVVSQTIREPMILAETSPPSDLDILGGLIEQIEEVLRRAPDLATFMAGASIHWKSAERRAA